MDWFLPRFPIPPKRPSSSDNKNAALAPGVRCLSAVLLLCFLLTGCAGARRQLCKPGVMKSTPSTRPQWVESPASVQPRPGYRSFVGFSDALGSESAARRGALKNAYATIARFLGMNFSERMRVKKIARNEFVREQNRQIIAQRSDGLWSRVSQRSWYVRKVCLTAPSGGNRISWQSYVRVEIPQKIIRRELRRTRPRFAPATELKLDVQSVPGRILARKILGQLTRDNLPVKPNRTLPADKVYFVIRTRLRVTGELRMGSWYSRVCRYRIDVKVHRPGESAVLVRSFSGQQKAVGSSKREAIERGSMRIARKHHRVLRKILHKQPRARVNDG